MLIVDALRRSNLPQEVNFLLTCYIDGLQFYDAARALPAGITALPVHGADEIEARLMALQQALGIHASQPGESDRVIVNELAEVFAEALHRLKALEAAADLPASALGNMPRHAERAAVATP